MSESVEKSFAKIRELTVEGLEVIIEERLVEVLSLIDRLNDKEKVYAHTVMALHYMLPETPMPQTLLNFLSEQGLTPNVRVQTEEEEKALLQQSGCTCEKCQELSTTSPSRCQGQPRCIDA